MRACVVRARVCVCVRTVESRAVLSELVDDLVHLERGEDGLDERRGADGAARNAESLLGEHEHVVPQARLLVRLHLRKVEVGAAATSNQLANKQNNKRKGVTRINKENESDPGGAARPDRMQVYVSACPPLFLLPLPCVRMYMCVCHRTFFALWKK